MSGGSAFTSRVSAALRRAGLPVLRYHDRLAMRIADGIRVGNDTTTGVAGASVSFTYPREADNRSFADKAEAVLRAKGFACRRYETHLGDGTLAVSITVLPKDKAPAWFTTPEAVQADSDEQ